MSEWRLARSINWNLSMASSRQPYIFPSQSNMQRGVNRRRKWEPAEASSRNQLDSVRSRKTFSEPTAHQKTPPQDGGSLKVWLAAFIAFCKNLVVRLVLMLPAVYSSTRL